MIAVMLSVQPKWCGKIANLLKKYEVRKSQPNIYTPIRCYIYCTQSKKQMFWKSRTYTYVDDRSHNWFDICGNGKVIGEFICDRITKYPYILDNEDGSFFYPILTVDGEQTGMEYDEVEKYGAGDDLYFWHITKLQIYSEPKKLTGFTGLRRTKFGYEPYTLTRPPQSWCYVEMPA